MKMSKKPRGNIHKIREFELEKINLVDEFDILQIVGEGWFGKILLVEHRGSQTEMVLKAVPKPYVSIRDFFREFHYGLHLGIHRNIVTTYDVAFETAGFYIFTQEYAPLGDLTSNVTDTGVGEVYTKRVAKQIGAALDYMHSKDIVHRDVKLDNVLIYRSDFTRVKICDFGESFQAGTTVERRNEWLPYSPPEVLDIKPEGTYKADPSHDVWQFGIVIFVCLTGCLPWQKAASDDPRYMRYLAWFGATILPIRRTPKLFKLLSSRAQRMFKRFLEPRAERRPKNLTDLAKFLDDRWLAKTAEKEMAEYETDELCPSMYSFHSSPDEKHRLLYTLANCGIETNVDRQSKKNRIKDWIESSVITEEDEEELEDASPSSSVSREPVAGHISSIRATIEKSKEIKTTLKDATQKHFDPRTGVLQQGPSEMGAAMQTHLKSGPDMPPSIDNISTFNNGDSLCGSLLTLGSRPDLLSNQLQIYNSDLNLNLNRLGELDRTTSIRRHNYSLSSASLLTPDSSEQSSHAHPLIQRNNVMPSHQPAEARRSAVRPTQRSKSDSIRMAMYTSTPAIDSSSTCNNLLATPAALPPLPPPPLNHNTNQLANSNTLNGTSFISNSNLTAGNGDKSSVTFAGLANAFQSLASVTLPTNSYSMHEQQSNQQRAQLPKPQPQPQQTQEQQQQQYSTYYFNQSKNDSSIKDSAYGSADVSESPTRTINTPSIKPQSLPQTNGKIKQLNHQSLPTTRHNRALSPDGRPAQHRQQPYRGAHTSSMKDTAYDRVPPVIDAKKKR